MITANDRTNDRTSDRVPSSTEDDDLTVAPFAQSAGVVAGGHRAWIGLMWLVVAVLFAAAIIIIGNVGSLDESLWRGTVVSWQRWVIGAAGLFTLPTFLPMLVGNGVTRTRFAHATIVAMLTIATLGAAFIVLGYLAEGLAFEFFDWPHVLDSGGAPISGVGHHAETFVDHLLSLAAFFTSGWVVGLCWRRWQIGGLPMIVASLLPIAVTELMIRGESGIDVFDRLSFDPPLAVGVLVSTAAIAVANLAGVRNCRELELR